MLTERMPGHLAAWRRLEKKRMTALVATCSRAGCRSLSFMLCTLAVSISGARPAAHELDGHWCAGAPVVRSLRTIVSALLKVSNRKSC